MVTAVTNDVLYFAILSANTQPSLPMWDGKTFVCIAERKQIPEKKMQ